MFIVTPSPRNGWWGGRGDHHCHLRKKESWEFWLNVWIERSWFVFFFIYTMKRTALSVIQKIGDKSRDNINVIHCKVRLLFCSCCWYYGWYSRSGRYNDIMVITLSQEGWYWHCGEHWRSGRLLLTLWSVLRKVDNDIMVGTLSQETWYWHCCQYSWSGRLLVILWLVLSWILTLWSVLSVRKVLSTLISHR